MAHPARRTRPSFWIATRPWENRAGVEARAPADGPRLWAASRRNRRQTCRCRSCSGLLRPGWTAPNFPCRETARCRGARAARCASATVCAADRRRLLRGRSRLVLAVSRCFAEGEERFPADAGRIVDPRLVGLRITTGRRVL